MKEKKEQDRDAKTRRKAKQKAGSQIASSHYERRFTMQERLCEVSAFASALIASGMGSHVIALVWTIGLGLCAVILAFCFWFTDNELRRRHSLKETEEVSPTPTPMKDDRPNQSINTRNQTGHNIIAGGDINLGPQPRVISSVAREKIMTALRNHSPGEIGFVIESSAGDAKPLAEALCDAFASVNLPAKIIWDVGILVTPGPTTGVDVFGQEPLRTEVINALRQVDLPAAAVPEKTISPGAMMQALPTVVVQIRKVP